MIAFEVMVNGNKLCDAGVEGPGVLSATLFSALRVPAAGAQLKQFYPTEELRLEVGGLKSASDNEPGQHMSWLEKPLQVGDVILINIKSLETVDPPEKLVPQDPTQVREAKRRYFEKLKTELGE